LIHEVLFVEFHIVLFLTYFWDTTQFSLSLFTTYHQLRNYAYWTLESRWCINGLLTCIHPSMSLFCGVDTLNPTPNQNPGLVVFQSRYPGLAKGRQVWNP